MTNIVNYPEANFATSSDIDTIMCDIQRTSSSNMHSSITYSTTSQTGNINTWDGVSRNNVALYNGLALGN